MILRAEVSLEADMAIKLIADGQIIEDSVNPSGGGEPLQFAYRPPLATEIAQHRSQLMMKSGADRERLRLEFLATRLVRWGIPDKEPTFESLNRLDPAYTDPLEERVLGYVVRQRDDEKKSPPLPG